MFLKSETAAMKKKLLSPKNMKMEMLALFSNQTKILFQGL